MASTLYLVPGWFLNFSLIMQVLITLISIAISLVSIKIYRILKEREFELFGMAFLLIGISYLIWTVLNLFVYSKLAEMQAFNMGSIATFGAIMLYSYFILFILGMATLAYLTLGIKGKRAYIMIAILSLLPIILSQRKAYAFFTVTAILVLMVVTHYLKAFIEKKTKRKLITLTAFILILISRIELYYSSTSHIHYIVGHSVEILAFLLLLINLLPGAKHEKKKQARNR